MKTFGLMPVGKYEHPVSRDYDDIDCLAIGCQYNVGDKCMIPSLCQINANGHCNGFKPKMFDNKKVDGD